MRARPAPGVFLVLALPPFAAPGGSKILADFYKGKTIDLIVGLPAGGGYDAYGRDRPPYGDHIPGNPAIVPQNMPGAGG